MLLAELIKAIEQLTAEELQALRAHLEQQKQYAPASAEKDALDAALEALREGLTAEQLDALEWAMNVETVRPVDKAEWQK